MNQQKQVRKFISAMIDAETAPTREDGLKAVKKAAKAAVKLAKAHVPS
jgi:hypothetical protein